MRRASLVPIACGTLLFTVLVGSSAVAGGGGLAGPPPTPGGGGCGGPPSCAVAPPVLRAPAAAAPDRGLVAGLAAAVALAGASVGYLLARLRRARTWRSAKPVGA